MNEKAWLVLAVVKDRTVRLSSEPTKEKAESKAEEWKVRLGELPERESIYVMKSP